MRALVLAGGGSHGDYEVGALKHLLYDLEKQYDILCGISVGALNAGYLSQYHKGYEKNAYKGLERLWLGIEGNRSIRKHWLPFSFLHGLWRPSLYNTGPLKKLVFDNLRLEKTSSSGKLLRVGGVSLTSGKYHLWTEKDKDLKEGILASSSFPIFFEPIDVRGEKWSDGGIRNVTPLKAAIDLGATHIDVIIPSDGKLSGGFNANNVIKVGLRTIEIMMNELMAGDLHTCEAINRALDGKEEGKYKPIVLNVLRPKGDRDHDSLEFNPKYIREGIELGYSDAKKHEWV